MFALATVSPAHHQITTLCADKGTDTDTGTAKGEGEGTAARQSISGRRRDIVVVLLVVWAFDFCGSASVQPELHSTVAVR